MVYLDNGATTYPKPKNVYKAVSEANIKYSFNSGRGGYKASVAAAGKIFDVRSKVAGFFDSSEENVIFTSGCTQSLNMAIKGSVKKGEHIIISSLEHNAVARPVHKLVNDSMCELDIVVYNKDKEKIIKDFKSRIKSNTTLAIFMVASNVFGVTYPINEIGKICKENGITFVVDAAQGAGVLPIDIKNDNIDILCVPSHKGLYGIMGSGIMVLGDNIKLDTIIEGGTGSKSFDLNQPSFNPDRFESGTLNNSGIISIGAGIDYINSVTMEKIYSHEMSLVYMMYDDLSKMDSVKLYVDRDELLAPILSFNVYDMPSEEVASRLADLDIATRAGFHCSPLAHSHFDTSDRGTVRICPSAFTTVKECEFFIKTLKNVK